MLKKVTFLIRSSSAWLHFLLDLGAWQLKVVNKDVCMYVHPTTCSDAKTSWTLWPSPWWTCGLGCGCGWPRAGMKTDTTRKSHCTTRAGQWTSPHQTATATSTPCWRDWRWRQALTGSTTNLRPTSTAVSSQVSEEKPGWPRSGITWTFCPTSTSTMHLDLATVSENTDVWHRIGVSHFESIGAWAFPVFLSCIEHTFNFQEIYQRICIQNHNLHSCRQHHRAIHSQLLPTRIWSWLQIRIGCVLFLRFPTHSLHCCVFNKKYFNLITV